MPDPNWTDLGPEDLAGVDLALRVKRHKENGELRAQLRQTFPGDVEVQTGITAVPEGAVGGWQKSHLHVNATEMYIVQQGWLVAVWIEREEPQYHRYGARTNFVFDPLVPHNIFVAPGTSFFTTRYGPTNKKDRLLCPELDGWITEHLPQGAKELSRRLQSRDLCGND